MRTLTLQQTAGFSERSHHYFMRVQNTPRLMLDIINRKFAWWGCYRYESNPGHNIYILNNR